MPAEEVVEVECSPAQPFGAVAMNRSLKQSRRYDFRGRAEGRCRRWLKGVQALSAAAYLPEAAVELGHGLL